MVTTSYSQALLLPGPRAALPANENSRPWWGTGVAIPRYHPRSPAPRGDGLGGCRTIAGRRDRCATC